MDSYKLSWNDYHSNMSAGICQLLEEQDMVDVTLAMDGDVIEAHQMILSLCSPYFKSIFKATADKHPIVFLKDVKSKIMRDILQFMYRGQVIVAKEDLESFLHVAQELHVKGLTRNEDIAKTEGNDSVCESIDDLEVTEDAKEDGKSEEKLEKSKCNNNNNGLVETNERKEVILNSDLERNKAKTNEIAEGKAMEVVGFVESQSASVNSTVKRVRNVKTSDASEPKVKHLKTDEVTIVNNESPKSIGYLSDEDNIVDSLEIELKEDNDLLSEKIELPKSVQRKSLNKEVAKKIQVPKELTMTKETVNGLKEEGVTCPQCQKLFANAYNLKVHIRDKHNIPEYTLNCEICGKSMRNYSCLRVHIYHHRKAMNSSKVDLKAENF